MSADLAPLVTALCLRLEAAGGPIGEEINRVKALLDRKTPQHQFEPTYHPLIRHLPAALGELDADLRAVLRPVAHLLPWRYGYDARSDLPGLEAEMGWAEIVGPLAPFRNPSVCLGLTLIGPRTYYPPHRHPAVELYHVLAGTGLWTVAGHQTREEAPGAFILHPSGVGHAMRAGSQPLLAFYTWTGELAFPSVWAEA